jgi:DNA-binding CsgD family transcriptional regulator/N-acetylneuraminic acid mutarotase
MEDVGSLSDREIEVLKLVATGATNQQIARALVISPNTVKVHLRNIFEKLGVQSRTEATMEAVRRGLVAVPGAVAPLEPAAGDAMPTAAAVANVAPTPEPRTPVIVELPVAARRPVAGWQRVYLLAACLAVIAIALTPGWWRARSQASTLTPLSDMGQAQVAPAPRSDVARWAVQAALPAGRSRLALVSDGKKLYAVGGETAAGITGAMTLYDPRSNGWLPGADKPTAVSNVAAVFLNDRIYVPGGTTASGGVTNVLERYDPSTEKWEVRASLPISLTAYGLAALGDKIYLFGGWDGKRYRAETYVYDPARDAWATAAPMPEPRAFMGAAAAKDSIYVVGGHDGKRELASVLRYDPADEGTEVGPWSSRAPLSRPRGGLGLTAIGNRLYAVGGGWETPLAYNEQYDAGVDAWSRIATPLVGQWRNVGVAGLDNKLYAVGGWCGSYLSSNESYQALLRQLLPLSSSGG